MIYKREDYIEQTSDTSARFPVRQIEVLTDVDSGDQQFMGQVTLGLSTPMGVQQIPVSFEIEAKTIKEAFGKFEATAQPHIEEARKGIEDEISRMRREASGRIIRPDEVGMGGAGAKIIDFKNPPRA